MSEYHPSEGTRREPGKDDRIRGVLEQAVKDGASLLVAMKLGEPSKVVARWVDAVWDGLRDNLVDDDPPQEDRLVAIVLLLTDRMNAEAQRVLSGIPGQS